MTCGTSKATRPGQFCVISGFAGGACTRSNAASSNENSPTPAASTIVRASEATPGVTAVLSCEPSAVMRESGTPGAPIPAARKVCHGLECDATGAAAESKRAASADAAREKDPPVARSACRHDEAFRGHHHPAAILLADGIHPTEPGHDVALIDLDDAHAAFDERGPAINVAHHPSFDRGRLRLVGPARGRCERAGDVLGRSFAARKTLERIDGFGELVRRLGLAALDAVDAFADPAELGARVAVGRIDAELQRRQFDPRLHHVLFEPLDVLEGRSPRRGGG